MDTENKNTLEELMNKQHDVIIIGGGLVGSFIYNIAVKNNLNTILIEKSDFGKQTTNNSTGIAHGGIRYLANFCDWKLVREAVRERDALIENFPDQVYETEFLYPIYDRLVDFPPIINSVINSRIMPKCVSRFLQVMAVEIGLTIYDLMAYKPSKKFRRHSIVKKSKFDKILELNGLLAIVKYTDGKFEDPSKLTKKLISDGDCYGGSSLEHIELIGSKIDDYGKVQGIIITDNERNYYLKGNIIINATGPWIDKVNKTLTNNNIEELLLKVGGIHIEVPYFPGSEKLQEHVLVIPTANKNNEKRIVFLIPHKKYFLIGTTETKLKNGDIEDYKASKDEIKYLLSVVRQKIPCFNMTENDIIKTYAGVRPLVKQEGSITKASRKDLFHYDKKSGIISVSSKLTQARAVAERVNDFVLDLIYDKNK